MKMTFITGARWPTVLLCFCGTLIFGGCQVSDHPNQPTAQPGHIHGHPPTAATDKQQPTTKSQPTTGQTENSDNTDAEAEAEYQDLWHKIADARTITVPKHREVDYFKRQFSGRALFPTNASAAAAPWMYHIISELESRQMPLELVLLPLVESGFRPGVKGLGGAGLWQLSSQTGRNHKLRVNPAFDGRLDGVAATRAALDYLETLYEMFDHDWLSTVAAYNMGENKLMGAIKRNKRHGKASDFLSLNMSRNQAPSLYKWLAVVDLVREQAKQANVFPPIANTQAISRKPVPNGVSLTHIAEVVGMSPKVLTELNPAFKTRQVPASGDYQINLPIRHQENFDKALSALASKNAGTNSKRISSNGKSYKVRSGDTLSAIAKRQQIPLKLLLALNGLTKDSVIRPGQDILLQ